MKKLSAIESVRKARHIISEKANHDPETLVKYYINLQKNEKRKIITINEKVTKYEKTPNLTK